MWVSSYFKWSSKQHKLIHVNNMLLQKRSKSHVNINVQFVRSALFLLATETGYPEKLSHGTDCR
jgi:hypothetical protein